jgi:spoIIIJ-associated protein
MNESNQDAGGTGSTQDEEDDDDVETTSSRDDAPRARGRRRRPGAEGAGDSELANADERSREALAFTTDVIAKMGMDCDVRLQRPSEEGTDIQIHVTGPDAGRIIGKKGQVLAAVQFIVNRAMNRPGLERRYVSVDADGYRSRREDSLASMARRLGKQAVSDGQIITFEPMSPRDRRVVHLALAKFEGVVTKSEGEGDDRRVQIIPVRRG